MFMGEDYCSSRKRMGNGVDILPAGGKTAPCQEGGGRGSAFPSPYDKLSQKYVSKPSPFFFCFLPNAALRTVFCGEGRIFSLVGKK